ncbi:MAG TPA: phage major capsid protein [Vicinamibacterales bacterium]|nr:phage major capsid protein [Vicinamibacterales bacterium]
MEYTTDAFDKMTADYARMNEASAFVVARLAREALGSSAGEPDILAAFLSQRKSISRSLHALATKAAVAPLDTASGLAPATPSERAFLGQVQRVSPLGQIGGVRVDGNVVATMQITNPTTSWVGEAVHKPLTSMTFTASSLRSLKLIAQIIASQELADLSVPDALAVIQRSLVSATAAAEATALLDPASTAIAGVRPASVTSGLTPITPSGDFQNQVGQVLGALSGGDPSRPVLVVSFGTALRMMTFLPNLREAGVRVVVTSAAGNRIIGIDADGLLVVEGGVDIRRGTPDVIMDTTPAGVAQTAGAAPVPTSLWQHDLVALKVERWINWTARPGAVAYLTLA